MAQLTFPQHLRDKIDPYLPPLTSPSNPITTRTTTSITSRPRPLPHLTLTYATSLDSLLTLHPGTPTQLSGPLSKAMTHYLRTRHDAILIGSGTAIADDPSLFSRLDSVYFPEQVQVQTEVEPGSVQKKKQGNEQSQQDQHQHHQQQPQPIILDRRGRWDVRPTSKIILSARKNGGVGKAPWIIVGPDTIVPEARRAVVEDVGGLYIRLPTGETRNNTRNPTANTRWWTALLAELAERGIASVMVEGGAEIINGILGGEEDATRELVKAVVVTVAPVYLGRGGVGVSPERRAGAEGREVVRFGDVRWVPLGDDVVLCGRVMR